MSKADDGLRKEMHSHLRSFHWQAIESALTAKGIPDTNACGSSIEFWIEFKSIRGGWRTKVDPFQVAWMERRLRSGGRAFVAIRRRIAQVRVNCDEFYLFHGSEIRKIMLDGIERVEPLVFCQGGPSRWDWETIERALLNTTFSPERFRTSP